MYFFFIEFTGRVQNLKTYRCSDAFFSGEFQLRSRGQILTPILSSASLKLLKKRIKQQRAVVWGVSGWTGLGNSSTGFRVQVKGKFTQKDSMHRSEVFHTFTLGHCFSLEKHHEEERAKGKECFQRDLTASLHQDSKHSFPVYPVSTIPVIRSPTPHSIWTPHKAILPSRPEVYNEWG